MIDIICHMDMNKIQSQLVLQYAPLIVGLKISNLFVTEPRYLRALRVILGRSDLSFYVLTYSDEKVTCFIYRKKSLETTLEQPESRKLLSAAGYPDDRSITGKLLELRRRYRAYLDGLACFPHEMGVFLGYPIEDVCGFMEDEGKSCLYSGYWKVYKDVEKKKEIFEMYSIAKESLICLLTGGLTIEEIIDTFCCKPELAA